MYKRLAVVKYLLEIRKEETLKIYQERSGLYLPWISFPVSESRSQCPLTRCAKG